MITNINANPTNWKKQCWIASKIGVIVDDDENEISVYSDPTPYKFNYLPVSSDAEIAEFGEKASIMQRAVIPISYKDMFKEFDVAYLDNANPKDEMKNGENANYRLLPPRNGNAVIIIYFEKLTGK